MAGYSDTRQMIIDTLMGRPAGTEIQPEDHQAFALQITDYVRSVELVAGNATPIGFADALTVPVQPDNGQAVYLSQVGRGTTVVFTNFIDQNGNAISVTSDSSSVTFVTLLWNGQYWTKQETRISLENTVQENDIADGAVTTDKIKDGAVTETKIADGSITGDKFSPGLTLFMNQQFGYLKQVQIQYGGDPSAAIKSFAQRDNKTALYIKLTNGLLVPANTNGETASGLYSYGNTVRKVLFDGTNWSDVEIQSDIIDTAHIKDEAVTHAKLAIGSVSQGNLQQNSVNSYALQQSAVENEHIHNGAVDTTKLADSSVTTPKIADDAVTTKKLQQWVIRQNDSTADIALWNEIKAFNPLTSKIPNIVFIRDNGSILPVQKIFTIAAGEIYELQFFSFSPDEISVKQIDPDNVHFNVVKVTIANYGEVSLNVSFESRPFDYVMNIEENWLWGTVLKDESIDASKLQNGSVTKSKLEQAIQDLLDGAVQSNKLSPVLQEINLTGTDAERKAKLDQFEKKWKALTGASSLEGARFVGNVWTPDESGNSSILFTWQDSTSIHYTGFALDSDVDSRILRYQLRTDDGSLTITPLFSHLEAITIYTDNTPEHIQANLNNIAAYEANLENLGIDITKSPMIPFKIAGSDNESGIIQKTAGNVYTGYYCYSDENRFLSVRIEDGNFLEELYPISSDIVNVSNYEADNEFRAKSLEAITIKTGNTTADKADNKAAIQAYIDNLTALGVDTTKGYNIPIYVAGQGSGFIGKRGDSLTAYMGIMVSFGVPTFGIYVDAAGGYYAYKLQTETDNSLTTTSKKIVSAINEVNALAKGVNAFGAIELKASDNDSNKAAITAYLKILTDAGVSTANGYSVPVRITGNSQEYHGMLNIGTGVLLSGIVTDVNENHHYPFNVSTTDGAILFDENNYFLEKTSNEVTEMLDAIKYSHTSVPFTDTTLSNKAQLEVFLSKVPDATVMHCTYKEIWAGTLHKINGDWYGLLVKNTNSPADNINIKLSADGTVITSNSAQ